MAAVIINPDSEVTLPLQQWPAACANLPTLKVNPYPPKHMGGNTYRLSAPGVYCWRDITELEHLLIVKPASRYECVKLIWEIVCASVNGNSSESSVYYTMAPGPAAFAFLEEPRVRSYNCGPAAAVAMTLLAAMGVYTRMIQWIGPTSSSQHQNFEAQTENGWTLADAHYGLIYADGYGAVDLWEDARASKPLAPKLAAFRNEASWVVDPWAILGTYDMAVLPRFNDVRIWPALMTASEAAVESALGGGNANVLPVTPAEMREAFYNAA